MHFYSSEKNRLKRFRILKGNRFIFCINGFFEPSKKIFMAVFFEAAEARHEWKKEWRKFEYKNSSWNLRKSKVWPVKKINSEFYFCPNFYHYWLCSKQRVSWNLKCICLAYFQSDWGFSGWFMNATKQVLEKVAKRSHCYWMHD